MTLFRKLERYGKYTLLAGTIGFSILASLYFASNSSISIKKLSQLQRKFKPTPVAHLKMPYRDHDTFDLEYTDLVNKKSIKDIQWSNQRVLMRVDYNVSINEHGFIEDVSRIDQSLASIQYLLTRSCGEDYIQQQQQQHHSHHNTPVNSNGNNNHILATPSSSKYTPTHNQRSVMSPGLTHSSSYHLLHTTPLDDIHTAITSGTYHGPRCLVLITHLGRPACRVNNYSTEPIIRYLRYRLGPGINIEFLSDPISPESVHRTRTCVPGTIFLCENLRFHLEEVGQGVYEGNKPIVATGLQIKAFCDSISSLGDIFVFEAYGAAHRAHSSIIGITCPIRVMGLQVEREVRVMAKLLQPMYTAGHNNTTNGPQQPSSTTASTPINHRRLSVSSESHDDKSCITYPYPCTRSTTSLITLPNQYINGTVPSLPLPPSLPTTTTTTTTSNLQQQSQSTIQHTIYSGLVPPPTVSTPYGINLPTPFSYGPLPLHISPRLAVVGAPFKGQDRLSLIRSLIHCNDIIFIAGGLEFTFLAAAGQSLPPIPQQQSHDTTVSTHTSSSVSISHSIDHVPSSSSSLSPFATVGIPPHLIDVSILPDVHQLIILARDLGVSICTPFDHVFTNTLLPGSDLSTAYTSGIIYTGQQQQQQQYTISSTLGHENSHNNTTINNNTSQTSSSFLPPLTLPTTTTATTTTALSPILQQHHQLSSTSYISPISTCFYPSCLGPSPNTTYPFLPSNLYSPSKHIAGLPVDIGPLSRSYLSRIISTATQVIFLGVVGCYEVGDLSAGTLSLFTDLASATARGAFTVVCGGEAGVASRRFCIHGTLASNVLSFVSTGGGSSLTLLEGHGLHGLRVLSNKHE